MPKTPTRGRTDICGLIPRPWRIRRLEHFGNCPVSSERGPGLKNVDFGLSKFFPITERQSLEFRAEAINAFNTPILLVQGYVTDVFGGSNFGVINTSEGARNLQFALKFHF